MSRPVRCPYLSAEWEELRQRRGMSRFETLQRWRLFKTDMQRLGFSERRIVRFGLANPFASELAREVMIEAAMRGKGREKAA